MAPPISSSTCTRRRTDATAAACVYRAAPDRLCRLRRQRRRLTRARSDDREVRSRSCVITATGVSPCFFTLSFYYDELLKSEIS